MNPPTFSNANRLKYGEAKNTYLNSVFFTLERCKQHKNMNLNNQKNFEKKLRFPIFFCHWAKF